AVEQHRVETNRFQDKMKEALNENEQLLEQAISKDIVNIVWKFERGKDKKELEEIETINIELDHRVTKLVTENEHLKQTYKQLYDSIKSSRVRSKDQCADLIKQGNIKFAENSDLNASLQEKALTGKVFTTIGYKWRPAGRTFTIVGNVCLLTRITTTAIVPLRKPIPLESNTSKPVVTLVYSRKPKESRNNVLVSNSKINKSLSADKKEPNKYLGSTISNVPSSSTVECRLSKLFSGIWTLDAPST
nr:hypothetical protein [Tanacetum cinerariifolium]